MSIVRSVLSSDEWSDVSQAALPGTEASAGASLIEALGEANADFEVALAPMFIELEDSSKVEVPDSLAAVRTDTSTPIGTVGLDYPVVQTYDQLSLLDEMVNKELIELSTVRVLGEGSSVQVAGALSKTGQEDAIVHFIVGRASHDGLSSISYKLRSVRLCNLSCVGSTNLLSKRHARLHGSQDPRVEDIVEAATQKANKLASSLDKLRSEVMSLQEFKDIANKILGKFRGPSTGSRADVRRENEINQLEEYFYSSKLGTFGETKLDAFNAIASWIELQKSPNGRNRFTYDSRVSGPGARLRELTLDLLT